MKKFLIATMIMTALNVYAQEDIKLPSPDFDQQSLSVIEALQTRHSVRSYQDKDLTLQQLGDLCWAACGQSRDDQHITAPSALNRQEIRLFVFTKEAVYEYIAADHKLIWKTAGDHRALIAGAQEFVMEAPVSLLMVIDFDKFQMEGERALMMGCVDAGNVSENINLYCQSVGLATVPRASMDTEAICTLLGFSDALLPIINNPVGFERK